MRTLNKIISAGFLLIWSVLLVLIITFGTSTASKIYKETYALLKEYLSKTQIDDVTVEGLPDTLIFEKTYTPTYTALTENGKEVELSFESLDKDVLTVNSKGGFKANKTGDETVSARIKITSNNDYDFEKIVTLSFYKAYPNDFSVTPTGATLISKGVAYVNLPVYVKTSFTSATNEYSEKDVEYFYDEEYFTKLGYNKFLPIKQADSAYIGARMANGEERYYNVEIKPERKKVKEIDQIKVTCTKQKEEGRDVFRYNETAVVQLYYGGKRVYTDFDITLKDKSFGSITEYNYINFKKAGTVEFTVTLPNGFTMESSVVVKNIVLEPEVFADQFNENGEFEVTVGQRELIKFLYPEEATYKIMKFEFDEECLNVYNTGQNAWSVTAYKSGVHDVKVVVDDGVDKITVDLKINASTGESYKTWTLFFAKIIGHMGLFFVEGMLIMYFLRSFKFKRKWTSVFICVGLGLFLGALTEFIQRFIPGRSSTVTDIFIDFTGYLIGITIAVVLQINRALKRRSKAKERQKREARKLQKKQAKQAKKA